MSQLRRPVALGGAAVAFALSGLQPLQAQAPMIAACYVPAIGAVYLIQQEGLPDACVGTSHIQIGWPAEAAAEGGGTVTSVVAGVGLSGGTITTTGTIDVAFDGPGAANTVARSDHDHKVEGAGNVAAGNGALWQNTTGTQNTAFGSNALRNNTAGTENVVVGAGSMDTGSEGGSNNTAIGAFVLRAATGDNNTAVGQRALEMATTGGGNTAVGRHALRANATGTSSTAVGASALAVNTSQDNTAVGTGAMRYSTDAGWNTAIGPFSLQVASGDFNTGLGWGAAINTAGGIANVAVGYLALSGNTSGNRNIAIGLQAGQNATTGHNNIYLGNPGVAAEGRTIRVGTEAAQDRTFIAGIRGTTTDVSNAVAVVIDSDGQLGTVSSSARFKDEIADMGDGSRGIMGLRPVTFRYRQPARDGTRPVQYGLVAEEVEAAFPDLVAYGADGRPETVKYHVLPALLLNEVQRQERRITALEAGLEALRAELAALRSIRNPSRQP